MRGANSPSRADRHYQPRLVLLAVVALAANISGVEFPHLEGTARGFPVLRDSAGKKLANGDFAQWLESGRLHVRIRYDFGGGRRIQEDAVFRQRPELVQEAWSFREFRRGDLVRAFDAAFTAGRATARKREDGELKEWTDEIDVVPGRTFAGFGFALAIKGLRDRLVRGEHLELQAIGFAPQPRAASVEISHAGLDELRMADRTFRGDRFLIHVKVPWIASLFVDVPDTSIWLTHARPASFLRWEGPLAEPGDRPVRVDLLPGRVSGDARPVNRR